MRVNLDSNTLRFGACSNAMRPARELPSRHGQPTAYSAPAGKLSPPPRRTNTRQEPEISRIRLKPRHHDRFDEDERV